MMTALDLFWEIVDWSLELKQNERKITACHVSARTKTFVEEGQPSIQLTKSERALYQGEVVSKHGLCVQRTIYADMQTVQEQEKKQPYITELVYAVHKYSS
jgi:hypothetical protein